MISEIWRDPELFGICGRSCVENAVGLDICPALLRGDDLDDDKVVILKVDQFYSSKRMHNPPKAVDCLVVVKCEINLHDVILAELRDVSSLRNQRISEILEKFRTTFVDFMTVRFGRVFDCIDYPIRRINAWLVIDPFGAEELSDEDYHRKLRGTMLDFFQLQRPFRVGNKKVLIEPKRPNPRVCSCNEYDA